MDTVETVLGLCFSIYSMAENVKANKERCQRVAKRVKSFEELLMTIKQRGLCQSPLVNNALRDVHTTLLQAKTLMMKFSETKSVMQFIKSSSTEDKFAKINESLNDNFQILSGALQIEQGDTLKKMCHSLSRDSSFEGQCIGFENQRRLMSQDSVYSPTEPPMTTRPLMSPTSLPMITSPTTAMPVPSVMHPMSPTSVLPMHTQTIVPANNAIMPMNYTRPVAPSLYTPTVVSQPYMNTVFIPPKPVFHSVASVTVRPMHTVTQMYTTNTPQMAFTQTNQSVVTTYVINTP